MHLTFFKYNSTALRIGHLCVRKERQTRGPKGLSLELALTQRDRENQSLMTYKKEKSSHISFLATWVIRLPS